MAEGTRGKLAQKDLDSIQENYVYLKTNLEANDLLDHLFQYKVRTLDDKEKIQTKKTKIERNEILLSVLIHSGPGNNFQSFLRALEENGYTDVLKTLGRTVNPSSDKKRKNRKATSGDVAEKQLIPPRPKKSKKDDIIRQLTEEKEKIAEELNTKCVQISQLEEEKAQAIKDLKTKEADMLDERNEKDEKIRALREENAKLADESKAKDDHIFKLKEEKEIPPCGCLPKCCDFAKNLPSQAINFAQAIMDLETQKAEMAKLYVGNVDVRIEQDNGNIMEQIAINIKDMEIDNAELGNVKEEKEEATAQPIETAKKNKKKTIRLISKKDFKKCVENAFKRRGKNIKVPTFKCLRFLDLDKKWLRRTDRDR